MLSLIGIFMGPALIIAVVMMSMMVKSKERVLAKLGRSVRAAGPEVTAGIRDAEDPAVIALKDIKNHTTKMSAGLTNAINDGRVEAGLKKPLKRGSYHASAERAGRNYASRVDDIVKNYGDGYDEQAKIVEAGQMAISKMPKATFEDKQARARVFAETTHKLQLERIKRA